LIQFKLTEEKSEHQLIETGMKESIYDFVHDKNFSTKDTEYEMESEQYIIVQYNLNGNQFYTIDHGYRSSDYFWPETKILVWDDPSNAFKQLCDEDCCPVGDYIFNGSLAHQSDLKSIFKILECLTEEEREAKRKRKQKDMIFFEYLVQRFIKEGSGVVKFSYNPDIEKLFKEKRPDIILKKNDNDNILYHNLNIW